VLCPLGTFEMAVTAILPPTVDAPGGALALAPLAAQPVNYGQTLPADPNCLGAATAPVQVTATVRTWGYSLIGNATGYAGRPVEVQDPTNDFEPAFELKYENEDLLSCPIMPDSPEAWPPPQAALDACEADVATCRATCERLVLSRRARRIFYVTNRCSQQGETTCYNLWVNPATTPYRLVFPMPQGPVVFFKLGVKRPTGGNDPPQRGAFLSFSTGSGYSPTSRVPYTGSAVSAAVLPGRVLLFDKTAITKLEGDGIHGFAAYVDNLVLEFASGAAAQNATTIR
jgi:hypothetical protein